jgi:hypothetical protein
MFEMLTQKMVTISYGRQKTQQAEYHKKTTRILKAIHEEK